MRVFLLPISTRRTLIYCERLATAPTAPGQKAPLSDRIVNRAAETWAKWERAEKGWQKQITGYGNRLFKRIPFEEWGLKSLPPATKQRLQDVTDKKLEFECHFPAAFVGFRTGAKGEEDTSGSGAAGSAVRILQRLATERQNLHRRSLYNCFIWMPISFPFTFVPVLPNLPFYYLCFRAWSHYRALYGSKLLAHLMTHNLIKPVASPAMDRLYTAGLLHSSAADVKALDPPPPQSEIERVAQTVASQTEDGAHEVMLLHTWNGQLLAEEFKLPELEIEVDRAVEQVEKTIAADEDARRAVKDALRPETSEKR